VPVVVEGWVSLWSLPPKEAMVALVSKGILVVVILFVGGDGWVLVLRGEFSRDWEIK
jgi:hypothetical protein